MELWSTTFLEEGPGEYATCAVTVSDWRRLTDEHEGVKRLIAQITVPETGKVQYAALGSPISLNWQAGQQNAGQLFLPPWMLERLEITGCGEHAEVEWLSEEAFPEATRIKLRPHDSAFYHVDAKEELERCLTRVGVLQLGQTIPLPLEGLGGYEVQFDVVELEPAQIVLANGEEVALEFDEALDAATAGVGASAVAPPVPEPTAPPTEDWSSLVPDLVAPAPAEESAGYRLGGQNRPRLADGRPWNPWRDIAR
jgi:hypothetical protein